MLIIGRKRLKARILYSREEIMQLIYASLPGSGVVLFLHSRVSIGSAFTAGWITTLLFYFLIKKANQLVKK